MAPIHLLDPETQRYNAPFLPPETRLLAGYRRMQGVVTRSDETRETEALLASPDLMDSFIDEVVAIASRVCRAARLMTEREPGTKVLAAEVMVPPDVSQFSLSLPEITVFTRLMVPVL